MKNMPLMDGEIVKVSAIGEQEDHSFHVYVLNSQKREGVTTCYAVLPVHIIPNNKSGYQKDLELLRTQRGHISDRIKSPTHKEQHYRAILQLESIPARGNWRFTPVDRITDITAQKQIEKKLLQSFVQSNFSMLNGAPLFIRDIDESRAMSKADDSPYYIDIDVLEAAAAGFIPKSVAKILKEQGKVNRLGTAANFANDPDADKLRQIYDRTLPSPKITYDYFLRSIKKGMLAFVDAVTSDVKAFQEKLPQGVILKYPNQEPVKFKFVERRPDLSIEDAFRTHAFISEEITYKTLKAAGFKTLRHAFEALKKHDVKILREAFHKSNKVNPSCSLKDIQNDVWEAYHALWMVFDNPSDYAPFPCSTQTAYPVQEVK